MPRLVDKREEENIEIKNRLIEKQNIQKAYYDKKANDLSPLKINDKAFARKELDKPNLPATDLDHKS